jgi:hypothetical protein
MAPKMLLGSTKTSARNRIANNACSREQPQATLLAREQNTYRNLSHRGAMRKKA